MPEIQRKGAKDAKDAKQEMDGLREPPEDVNDVSRQVIGAAIAVHRELGPGFLEQFYEEALSIELAMRALLVERQVCIPVHYKGRYTGESRLDLVVEGTLVVELKAVDELRPVHHAQLLSYLRAGAFDLGLLINFNVSKLVDGIKRIVCTL